jgi:hypothetical protein
MTIMKRCAHDDLMHTHGAHQHDDVVAQDDEAARQSQHLSFLEKETD